MLLAEVDRGVGVGVGVACKTNAPFQSMKLLSCGFFSSSTPPYLFIYLGFSVAFNTVQVISRRVVGRAEETST